MDLHSSRLRALLISFSLVHKQSMFLRKLCSILLFLRVMNFYRPLSFEANFLTVVIVVSACNKQYTNIAVITLHLVN